MLATVLTQAVWFSVASLMAVLARKRFGAGDWQTLMITAAVPTLMITAVFWNHLLRRIPLRRYLAIHWACTMIPLAVAGLSNSFPFLLTFHILAAIGAAGWSPIAGELLRRFYGDQVRGRAFGLINVAMFLGMIALSITIGRRLDANEDIFRIYLPGAAVAYGLGILILRRLVRSTGVERERRKELDDLAVCSPEPRASARADSILSPEPQAECNPDSSGARANMQSPKLATLCDEQQTAFERSRDDDFNTGSAIAGLFDFAASINRFIEQGKLESASTDDARKDALGATRRLISVGRLIGLFLDPPEKKRTGDDGLTDSVMQVLIEVRQQLRKNKDFETADLIRDRLAACNITLEDRAGETSWRVD